MKDRLFIIIIIGLLGVYLLNRFGDSAQIEATIKNSDIYKTYQQHIGETPEPADLTPESQPSYNPAENPSISTKNASGLSISHFQEVIQKPVWYDRVEAPIANTSKEVSKVWQSKKRCCESKKILKANNQEFYKTCYRAIENNFTNEELVVKCLWLMDSGAPREQSLEIKRFLVTHFSHHKNDVTHCVNCAPADTVARVTLELANTMNRQGDSDKSIALVERVLDTRIDEISPWVQIEIYSALSNWYTEENGKRRNRLQQALQNLDAIRKSGNKSVHKRLPRFEKSAEKFLGDSSNTR